MLGQWLDWSLDGRPPPLAKVFLQAALTIYMRPAFWS